MNQSYIIEPFESKKHISKGFACGVKELDIYLKEKASQEIKKSVTAVYILRENTSLKILGYFTLSSSSIELSELPLTITKKLPKYKTLGVILLGRLARDNSVKAKGIGEYLIMEALSRSHELSKKLGSFAVIVDAKDEKVKLFYKEYGFIPLSHRPLTLYLPMSTIKQLLI
jgi:predicted GNAT family N-acyltransferase